VADEADQSALTNLCACFSKRSRTSLPGPRIHPHSMMPDSEICPSARLKVLAVSEEKAMRAFRSIGSVGSTGLRRTRT